MDPHRFTLQLLQREHGCSVFEKQIFFTVCMWPNYAWTNFQKYSDQNQDENLFFQSVSTKMDCGDSHEVVVDHIFQKRKKCNSCKL